MAGFVSLVGAGPWNPELLTLGGKERLERADVVIADYLVNPAMLVHCRADVIVHQRIRGPHPGPRLDQDRINALMVEHANAGQYVVRLKGGDPMVFGRGAEEAGHLRAHGVEFEFVPGVSSPIAAPEYAGIPITHRQHTPSVSFVSGYEAYKKDGLEVAWEHLANSAGTLVLMMSVKNCRQNAERLVAAGRDAATPAAVVRWGTRGIQRTVVGTLADIADRVEAEGIRAPATLIVGDVVRRRTELGWFERRPLFGRRILVTRAAPSSHGLIHLLAANGADAVAFPCLEFAEPADPGSLTDAVRELGGPGAADGVILSSAHGTEVFFDTLEKAGLDARILAGRLVAAIGTGTAARCRSRGIEPDVVPSKAHSEGLAGELAARGLLARRWVHFRAETGREVLREAIERGGGRLDLVVGYRTVRPHVPDLLLRSLAPPKEHGEGYDAVCFASGKAARHFLETVTEGLGEAAARRHLSSAKVIALGPVTADAVTALGVRVDSVARETSDRGMLDSVLSILRPVTDP